MIGDEAKTMAFSKELLRRGVYVSGIVFPTVPKGKGRIRCMVSALHTKEMLQKAVDIIFETAKDMAIL
jgi:glycine C-acetyltransferase